MKHYKKYCRKCHKPTEQIIWAMNIRKGVKLRCLTCGKIDNQYSRNIDQWEIQQTVIKEVKGNVKD